MNLIDYQYAFVTEQLRHSAKKVGLNIDDELTNEALHLYGEFWFQGKDAQHDDIFRMFSPQARIELERIIALHKDEQEWIDVVMTLARAVVIAAGDWVDRDWDGLLDWSLDDESSQKYRVLCDYAMAVGDAAATCFKFINEERPKSITSPGSDFFSSIGKIGSQKRHAPMNKLEQWAVEKYRAGKYASANDAAYQLTAQVIEHGKKIGAHLKPSNAQRTIAEWFRKSV